MCQEIKLHETDDIEKIVSIGDEVEVSDPLITFGMGDTGDKAVDNFLRAFQGTDFISQKQVKSDDIREPRFHSISFEGRGTRPDCV